MVGMEGGQFQQLINGAWKIVSSSLALKKETREITLVLEGVKVEDIILCQYEDKRMFPVNLVILNEEC